MRDAARVPLSERLHDFAERLRQGWRIDVVTDDGVMIVSPDGLAVSNVPFGVFIDAAKALHAAEDPEAMRQRTKDAIADMRHDKPYLGAIVLVNWTFYDDDYARGAEGRGTIRRDAKIPSIVTKIWPDKLERDGISVLTFPFGESGTTLYAERGENASNEWTWPEYPGL